MTKNLKRHHMATKILLEMERRGLIEATGKDTFKVTDKGRQLAGALVECRDVVRRRKSGSAATDTASTISTSGT